MAVLVYSSPSSKPAYDENYKSDFTTTSSTSTTTNNETITLDTTSSSESITKPSQKKIINPEASSIYYQVTKVVDGDTIDANIDGKIERIRLIGINTPEVVDPRRPVECFGKEASENAKKILTGQKIKIEADTSQDDRDKYGRLLRYIWRSDGLFYNLEAIKQGYAFEYTYIVPYKYQSEFKAEQKFAKENKIGLWADRACTSQTVSTTSTINQNCLIKGNINSAGEKIYHLPNCTYYQQTIIDESQGESWFCTETEAQATGWRKAKNCP